MHEAVAAEAPNLKPVTHSLTGVRAGIPTLAEVSLAVGSALLLVLSFPDFDLWPLAWIGLVPLLVVVAQARTRSTAFVLGLLWGIIFFYGSCWWLTYPMIHYGHLPAWLAYLLLIFPVLLVGVFPALTCAFLAHLISRFGSSALLAAPFIWISLEEARYGITGQVWNTIGYSQAFHPSLIQSARWGGVYAVGFVLLLANSAIAFVLLRRTIASALGSLLLLILIALFTAMPIRSLKPEPNSKMSTLIVAIQPNVPMEEIDSVTSQQLLDRHFGLTTGALSASAAAPATHRVIIWPESPMNFSYSRDSQLRDVVSNFARNNQTSLMLNSLEPAPNGGAYNSALLVNQEGRIVAQYDKIRLMPFGEYVPLPRWLPGASSVRGIVGDFTPGSSYTLMPLGDLRAGVFICVEAAHPGIARTFTNEGADVLVNISNDGYLGPTPVMRQHLANAIFRAVENDRDIVRVTNSGISALITSGGEVLNATSGFEPAVRTWTIMKENQGTTFYTRHSDMFLLVCAMISLGFIAASVMTKRTYNRRG